MSDEQRPAVGGGSFEEMRQTNEHGAKYWSARDIQPLFGYGLMSQARDKLPKGGVKTEQRAILTHEQVGKEVREAIKWIGGTLPEQTPPAEPIKDVEKRLKQANPKLVLDGLFAHGPLSEIGDSGNGLKGEDQA